MSSATAQALAGRPAAGLLELPSVRRTAALLEVRCREPSWSRIAVATLERFRHVIGADLDELLQGARDDTGAAEEAVAHFGRKLRHHGPAHVSALAFGAKVWFRTNGVPVSWRPLVVASVDPATQFAERDPGTRLLLSAMIGSGLSAREAMALRVGDLGSLDEHGQIVADPQADPLAVGYRPEDGGGPRVSFLSHSARTLWLAGHDGDTAATEPFVRGETGGPPDVEIVDRAAARHAALIAAGNDANVYTCRLTGDFFRSWGMPGERFEQRRRAAR